MRDAEEKHCEYMIYFNIFSNVRLQVDKRNVSCMCSSENTRCKKQGGKQ
jgi:hypothetical protein